MIDFEKFFLAGYCAEYQTKICPKVEEWLISDPYTNKLKPGVPLGRELVELFASFATLDDEGTVRYSHNWAYCSGAFSAWLDYKNVGKTDEAGHTMARNAQPGADDFVASDLPKAKFAIIPLPIQMVVDTFRVTPIEAQELVIQWAEFCTEVGYPISYVGCGLVKKTHISNLVCNTGLPAFLILLERDNFVSGSHAAGAMQLARFLYIAKFHKIVKTALHCVVEHGCTPQEALYFSSIMGVADTRINSFTKGHFGFLFPSTKEELRELFASSFTMKNDKVWGYFTTAMPSGGAAITRYNAMVSSVEMGILRNQASGRYHDTANKIFADLVKAMGENNIVEAKKIYSDYLLTYKKLSKEALELSIASQALNKKFQKWAYEKIIA